MDKVERKMLCRTEENWNKLIEILLEAQRLWEDELRVQPASIVSGCVGDCARILSNYRLQDFQTALPFIMDRARVSGGLSVLLLEKIHEIEGED